MKRFAAVVLTVLLFLLPALAVGPVIDKAHKASIIIAQHVLSLPDGDCSATVIGPQAILTATHCEAASDDLFVGGLKNPLKIVGRIRDDNDHTIFLVDGFRFANFVPVALKDTLEASEDVFTWGAPGELDNIFQRGYVAGRSRDTSMAAQFGEGNPDLVLFSFQAYPGTSGSGIFNESGALIAVVSQCYVNQTKREDITVSLAFAGAYALAFTQADIDKAVAFSTEAKK